MLRGTILFVLLFSITLLALPFFISSLYIDQRGILLPGRINSKREDVIVQYSTWRRSSEVTVEYSKPDGTGISFLVVRLSPAEYDMNRVGQAVRLHYLRPQDVPDLPFARFLRRAQLLPTVRLANQQTWSGLRLLFTGQAAIFAEIITGAAMILLVWRIIRVPGFGWAVGVCVVLAVIALSIEDFPRPMPAPTIALKQSFGRVQSLARIDRLFAGSRSRGVMADQPIQVAGIEFTPEGRTEPVLAVDLIDAGSVPGLQEKSTVRLEYESQSPRIAYIRGASRQFVSRNLAGIGTQGIIYLIVLIVFLGGAQLLGRAYKRITPST